MAQVPPIFLQPHPEYSPIASFKCIALEDLDKNQIVWATDVSPGGLMKVEGATAASIAAGGAAVLLVTKNAAVADGAHGTNIVICSLFSVVDATLAGADPGDPVYLSNAGIPALVAGTVERIIGHALSTSKFVFAPVGGIVYA